MGKVWTETKIAFRGALWLGARWAMALSAPFVALTVIALATTVIGMILSYLITVIWISLWEWVHKRYNAAIGVRHKETGIMSTWKGLFVTPDRYAFGDQAALGPDLISHTDTFDGGRTSR